MKTANTLEKLIRFQEILKKVTISLYDKEVLFIFFRRETLATVR